MLAAKPQLAREEKPHRSGDGLVPAVEFTRGGMVESVHNAAAAVVDHKGQLVAFFGDPHYVTFSRSSLKPLQALATVMRGFPDKFGLAERHLALACASHSGERMHTQAAQEILDAVGASVSDLQCGVHIPLYLKPENGDIPPKDHFTAIHSNCSGKHSTMLALSRILNAPFPEYLHPDGQVQTLIRQSIVDMIGVEPASLHRGVDGCSAPNYAMPLSALATGFARYAWANSQPTDSLTDSQRAAAKIVRAMMAHPEMVAGTGRFDLQLATAAGQTLFSKSGAEAVVCVGIVTKGWGVALKIGDGAGRAIPPLMASILDQLGVLDQSAKDRLKSVAHPRLKNVRGLEVGTARAIARLVRE